MLEVDGIVQTVGIYVKQLHTDVAQIHTHTHAQLTRVNKINKDTIFLLAALAEPFWRQLAAIRRQKLAENLKHFPAMPRHASSSAAAASWPTLNNNKRKLKNDRERERWKSIKNARTFRWVNKKKQKKCISGSKNPKAICIRGNKWDIIKATPTPPLRSSSSLLPPSLPASPLFGCSVRRIMATDALQLARRHVTWSTHTRLDSTHPMHAALPPPPTPLSRRLLLHTLCGYLCLSLSMLSLAHGSLQQKRIFMLWPMFVLFELYVAFSIPYSPTPPHCSNVLYELSLWWPHSGIYGIFFYIFFSIFFYFLSNLINALRVSLVFHVMAFITAFPLTLTIYNFWCIPIYS